MRVSLSRGLLVFLFLATVAWNRPALGLTVKSDTLQIQEQTGEVRFEGRVQVLLTEATLTCDLLVVQTETGDSSRVRSGRATGSVVMVRGSDRIEAQEAFFDLITGSVELKGSPSLYREGTAIEAERIVYSLEKGSAQFFGPVRALFQGPGE